MLSYQVAYFRWLRLFAYWWCNPTNAKGTMAPDKASINPPPRLLFFLRRRLLPRLPPAITLIELLVELAPRVFASWVAPSPTSFNILAAAPLSFNPWTSSNARAATAPPFWPCCCERPRCCVFCLLTLRARCDFVCIIHLGQKKTYGWVDQCYSDGWMSGTIVESGEIKDVMNVLFRNRDTKSTKMANIRMKMINTMSKMT